MEARRRRKPGRGGLQRSGLFLIARDLVCLAAAMLVFALFHHVLPMRLTPVGEAPAVQAAEPPVPSALPSGAEPAATEPPVGDFSATFPTEDTGTGALYSHQTDDVRIAVQKIQEGNITYFLADVYVRNIEALQTAFARNSYGKNVYAFPTDTALSNGAVFAVTGDYYSARSKGIVVRNGRLYRDVPSNDVCILYRNGEMMTYAQGSAALTDLENQNIWQAWSFGPALLTADGGKINEFDSTLNDRHPRCGIGYYAPGHYCFIVVDGRQRGYSVGVRLTEFSTLFANLGCKQAYNFDGGATAIMVWNGAVNNQPYKGGRESGDIIYFK